MAAIGIKSFDASLKQAAELEKIAQEISNVRSQSKTIKTESNASWKGKSGNAARAALEQEDKKLQAMENDCRNIAKTIREVVRVLQEEMERGRKSAGKVNNV